MSVRQQMFFVIISIFTVIYVVSKIRKHKLNIDDSIIWIIWALLLLILSIFPQISIFLSKLFGFASTSNFIICLFIFFIYIIHFYQSITISELKEKNKRLIQKLSIKEYEAKTNKKE